MSSTGKSSSEEILGESWVELNLVPDRVTPLPFSSGGEEYLRLLREAQRDSLPSSARHSLASSRRGTPRDSPKSPPNSPNSPNTELSTEDELKGVYINYCCNKEASEVLEKKTDWIYEWSSRPDQAPPKDWKFKHPKRVNKKKSYSIRTAKVGKAGLFSKEVLYTLFITNILSVLVGAGLGVWWSRRGSITSSVTIE